MSFKVSEEILKKLEEATKLRPTAGLSFGEERDFIVYDARVSTRSDSAITSLVLACLVPGTTETRLYTYSTFAQPEVADMIVKKLMEGKVLKIKCRCFGNRILTIHEVREYDGKLEPNVIGVVRRSRDGSKVWIDVVEEGKVTSYLVSDMSIKGMKLCGEGSTGQKVIAIAKIGMSDRGVQIIQYIHYQIVEPEQQETMKEVEETTTREGESETTEETTGETTKMAETTGEETREEGGGEGESESEAKTEETTAEESTAVEESRSVDEVREEVVEQVVEETVESTEEKSEGVESVESVEEKSEESPVATWIEKIYEHYSKISSEDPLKKPLGEIVHNLLNGNLAEECDSGDSRKFIDCIVEKGLKTRYTSVVKKLLKQKLAAIVK